MTVFGSKSACFKCGTAKKGGGSGGGSGGNGAAAPAVVDTINISKADRALIRDLMDEHTSGASRGGGGADGAGGGQQVAAAAAASEEERQSRAAGESRRLYSELVGMGFDKQDLDRASDVCGGLRSINGALNWLLLHTPEERIPAKLGSIPPPKRAQGRSAAARKQDRKTMTDAQKVIDNLTQVGRWVGSA